MNSRKPHFLEIFLPNLSSERLEVPFKFIKYLTGRTTDSVSLTGPSGNSWHVDLIDHNGHLYFHGGWPTFVKDHSLQCGDSIVFRYDGNSHFTVQIFDESSCEKDEALNAICSQESMNCNGNLGKKRGRGMEASFLNVDGEKKHRGTFILVHPSTIENEYVSSTREFNASEPIVLALPCISNTEWEASIVKTCSKKKPNKAKKAAKNKQNTPTINTSLSQFIESRAAEYVISSSPYFVRVMNYSNISGNGTMKVPIKFSAVHLPNFRVKVTLKNLNGDCWMINCIPTAKKNSTSHSFCGGWLAFVRGNGIKIEDVCIFELVGEFEMLVRILRLGVEGLENQIGNSSFDECSFELSGWPLDSTANVTEDASGEDSEQLNDLFMNDYEEHEAIPAIQQKATDKFPLCNAEGTILNETIRDNEVDFKAGDTLENRARVEESPTYLTFSSPFPSFMKVMKNSEVGVSFTLNVPSTFSAAYLPSHKTNIVLRNMEGHSWNVVSARYGHQTKLCGGWMSFARENGVRVGDVCIFELVDVKVLQVRVFEGGHKGQEHQINDVADDSTLCTVLPELSSFQ